MIIPFSFWTSKGGQDGPIVTDQLAMNLDAGNSASYNGSGSTWFDISGNNRDMTLFNGVGYDSDSQGSLVFDGVDDYAKINNCGVNTFVNAPHTLEMWVNFDYFGPLRWWLAMLGPFNNGNSQHWIGTSATSTNFGRWGFPASQLSPNLGTIGTWVQVVNTFDGSTLRGYVNGALYDSKASTQAYAVPELTLGLRFGSEKNFEGKMAICRVYNKRLSDAEVLQNFNATKHRYGI